MRHKLEKIKEIIEELLAEIDNPIVQEDEENNLSEEFFVLKKLLDTEDWPEAVYSAQIADENLEQDKEERAEGISDMILPPLDNKKFLDLGCGEGHVSKYNSKFAEISVGFDIRVPEKSPFEWEKEEEKFLLTTDFEKVREKGPYDVILLYDVLDHTEEETMDQILDRAKSVLKEDGLIYLRCHPWCGRHGGHFYRTINKAFVHVVFEEDELRFLGLDPQPNQKVFYPIKTYDEMIEKAGLSKHLETEIDTQEVENFFEENPLVRSRIIKAFDIDSWGDNPPKFQMSQCFLDFVLKK
jgi:SAM-dependent methyltransferase